MGAPRLRGPALSAGPRSSRSAHRPRAVRVLPHHHTEVGEMKVRELMTKQPTTVEPNATLGEVATLMKQQDCGSIPVVEAGRLVGIVTDRDIVIRGVAAGVDPKTQRVSKVMSSDPVTIGADDDIDEA